MHDLDPIELQTGDGPHAWTVVLAHGRGGTPESMATLARRLNLDARVVLLQAEGGAWYPSRFTAPLDQNEPWLSAALAHVEGVVAGLLAQGTDPARLVVGGFSQGACLVSRWLLLHPRPLAAAWILTGGLIGPEDTAWPPRPELAGVRAYVSSSLDDSWIPPWRARETAQWLTDSGARTTLRMFDQREHIISEAEIDELRALMAS